ncbi:carbohydrate ABC transporter membrane protein 1, CUT1 family [Gracilibacillus orientalis]|uniref:Carbohydrate ABC transporter membrane protein 1, CUT1 family n=1 Tax=Gracilibacillus orientalis TaxID=334253 RepID=A0A1I4GWS6_9BACI|nr:sugar ABC transporter permease [Gracilibacillus orientalis]SFL34000.1 carbohydrate ABC transporter membrane protein 1, CUT1 family [Gracilibacillus orientalis]
MKTRSWVPYAFLLPNMLIFGIFVGLPAIYGVYYSFTEWDGISSPVFIGLENFRHILTDPNFLDMLKRTFIYVVLVVPFTVISALGLAWLLTRKIKFANFFRTIFYLPVMISFIVIGLMWNWILQVDTGLINYLLSLISIDPINWLLDPVMANISVIIVTIWARVGFFMVIFIAGLQNISPTLYEAADIDGASDRVKFFKITFPMLKPITLLVIILSFIEFFKTFALVVSLTGGGPINSTKYYVQYTYDVGFNQGEFGVGSALSLILFIIMAVITLIQWKISDGGRV